MAARMRALERELDTQRTQVFPGLIDKSLQMSRNWGIVPQSDSKSLCRRCVKELEYCSVNQRMRALEEE